MEPLTERQKAIFEFIHRTIQKRGMSPTVREIAIKFGMKSVNGPVQHIDALIAKGWLKKQPEFTRGLLLTAEAEKASSLAPVEPATTG